MKKRILFILLCCFILNGCSGAVPPSNKSEFQINISQSTEPGTIDPTLNSSFYGITILNHAFEGLMKWADDGNGKAVIVNGQASNYEVSNNGLVYTFHIRNNAQWSDGQPVTANDFKYAWDRAVDPRSAASYGYMISSLNCKWEAVDKSTFVVKLSVPCPYFLEICTFPITFPVRKDIIQKFSDKWTQNKESYITNGPFRLDSWVHNSYLMLTKNEHYYDYKNLGPDKIKIHFIEDNVARLNAFKSKSLDFIQNIPTGEIKPLIDSGKMKVDKSLGTCYVLFNNNDKLFSNKLVRKAFTMAIDRKYLVDQILQSGQVEASALIPYGINDLESSKGKDFRTTGGNYIDPSHEAYEQNCKSAKEALALSGYPDGKGFPIIDFHCSRKDLAEAIQGMWKKVLGVTVNITSEQSSTFLDILKNGKYQLAFTGWVAMYNDPINFLDTYTSKSNSNDAKYNNPKYDSLILDSKSTINKEKRMKNLHEAESILMNDYAISPLYYLSSPYMSQNIDKWFYTPLGYYFFTYCKNKK
jgi:oligopeptide transport system substrate-binding protein